MHKMSDPLVYICVLFAVCEGGDIHIFDQNTSRMVQRIPFPINGETCRVRDKQQDVVNVANGMNMITMAMPWPPSVHLHPCHILHQQTFCNRTQTLKQGCSRVALSSLKPMVITSVCGPVHQGVYIPNSHQTVLVEMGCCGSSWLSWSRIVSLIGFRSEVSPVNCARQQIPNLLEMLSMQNS